MKLVFRDVLNHGERSIRTSEAAACAGKQGQFWQMHAILFERQSQTWSTDSGQMLALMLTWAKELSGLDQAAFTKCTMERMTLKQLQSADAEQRTRGITSQPIFEIGARRLVGFQSVDVISAAIEAGLK